MVRLLLEEGMEFVLTERFCQDPVKSISVRSANWEEGVIIRTFISLVTIIILLESRDPFHARVAIPKAGKMGRKPGNR